MAADMTTTQKYLPGNYANAPLDAFDPDSPTFGYWFRRHKGTAVPSLFSSVVRVVLSRLEPQNAKSCKPAKMLLKDFVWPSIDCVVATVVAKSEIIAQEQVLSPVHSANHRQAEAGRAPTATSL